MKKYRKKVSVVVTAEQWFPCKVVEGVVYCDEHDAYGVQTLEGFMCCLPGDYIITGVRGEKYPCRQDIFEETYELVPEE